MSQNLKKEGKEFIAKTGTLIKRQESITPALNIEVKEGEQKCKTCNKIKSLDKFYKRSNKKPEIHCRKCRNKQRDRSHRHWKQQFIFRLSKLIDIECVKCGYKKNYGALDFHHIKKKNYNISRETRNLSEKNFKDGKVERILYEILINCEILCANCHREHHTKYFMKLKK